MRPQIRPGAQAYCYTNWPVHLRGSRSILLESADAEMPRRLCFKAPSELLKKLNQYAEHTENTQFIAEGVKAG
nr:hypothetical protein [Thioalkalivibrio sp.]